MKTNNGTSHDRDLPDPDSPAERHRAYSWYDGSDGSMISELVLYRARNIARAGQPARFIYGREVAHNGAFEPLGYCQDCHNSHATPAAAREHFKSYLTERALLQVVQLTKVRNCRACGKKTSIGFSTDFPGLPIEVPLCRAHLTKEHFERCFRMRDLEMMRIYLPEGPAWFVKGRILKMNGLHPKHGLIGRQNV